MRDRSLMCGRQPRRDRRRTEREEKLELPGCGAGSEESDAFRVFTKLRYERQIRMAGVPQRLSDGQQKEVLSILRRKLLIYLCTACTAIVTLTGVGLWQIYSGIRSRVERLVAKQFEEPHIRQIVAEVASTQAKSLLTEQIKPEVDEFRSQVTQQSAGLKSLIADVNTLRDGVQSQRAALDRIDADVAETKKRMANIAGNSTAAEEKLAMIEKTVEQTGQTLAQLQMSATFSNTVLAAQNDDRQAYDRLWILADDPSFPLREAAARVVQNMMDQHNPVIVRGGFTVKWTEGVDPNQLSLQSLKEAFEGAPPHVRLGIMEFVWEGRPDIPKRDRLQFLVDVLRTDANLTVVEYAGRYFAGATGDRLKPLAISQHLQWWRENADAIK